MKLKAAFIILIIAFLTQIAFSGVDRDILFERLIFRPEVVPDPLKGKEVIVRFYDNWHSEPKAYKKINVLYDNLSKIPQILNDTYGDIQGSSVVVIFEQDQTDEQVKSSFAGSVLAEKLDVLKERIHYVSAFKDNKQNENIFIDDALGEIIPNAKVDIYIRDTYLEGTKILLTSIETKDGSLQIPQFTGSIRYLSFEISSPDYGSTITSRFGDNSHIATPLVHKDSQAYQRAVRGKVVDEEGNPIKNAVLNCRNIRTLGQGLINSLNGQEYKSITDKDGKFCLYLPNEQNNERGFLIPPGSTYSIRVEASKELHFLPFDEPIENDTEKTIVMEKADYFRTFVFEDEEGVINDSRLDFISINITRPDKRSLRIPYNEFREGGYFPLGEYSANMNMPGDGEFEFEQITVDENSSEEIVFKLPERVIYSGQIVHGMTHQPMPGAFVIAFNSSSEGNLSMITKEQWAALHELSLEPENGEPAIKPVTDIYGIKQLIRTDEQGRFMMTFIPGEVYGFIAFEENYLPVMHRTFNLKFDENKISEIPAIKLYPAASVLINLKTEERISVNAKWLINENDNPSWTREFLRQDNRSEREYTTCKRWLENNKPQSFYIPADLNVQIKLETPYDDQWRPVEIPEMLNLAQGQTIDLGNITFDQAVEVFVLVVDSKGEPVEGIPVKTLLDERAWGLPHNSDESGISSFYINPGSNIQIGVAYYGQDGKYKRETILCDIKSQEDKGKLFKLQLSDEILERVLDNSMR
ncbi:MAG: hypothetical protein JXA96_08685 [Sedimentisphaerales bacterium]|nr:hypothetical protein [Sedimentisphaerales bacterium]